MALSYKWVQGQSTRLALGCALGVDSVHIAFAKVALFRFPSPACDGIRFGHSIQDAISTEGFPEALRCQSNFRIVREQRTKIMLPAVSSAESVGPLGVQPESQVALLGHPPGRVIVFEKARDK